jgi:hypothetical protein
MAYYNLHEELEKRSGLKLKLKINDNHSTMLSVRWEPDYTRVSLHRMFLQAPQNVMQGLSCYLQRKEKLVPKTVKHFIEENIKNLDYSSTLDRKKLLYQGVTHNLRNVYEALNREYFDDRLNLEITWFGNKEVRSKRRIVFGLYHDPLKLIKIHRILDNPLFPKYLLDYVVYHEMVHHVCPSYIDEKGIHRMHDKRFKEKEMQFRQYDLAQDWLKQHKMKLFA